MLQIDNKLVSTDIIQKKFFCDLDKCKGACCIHGDSGAPFTTEELTQLTEAYPVIETYLSDQSKKSISEQGLYVIDSDGDSVTPLNNNQECSYVVFDNGIAKCAIEMAYFDKKITFRKPVSCHLYPIRIQKYRDFDAVNYHQWEICKPALSYGQQMDTPIYKFLKDSIIRMYGNEFYIQLDIANQLLNTTDEK